MKKNVLYNKIDIVRDLKEMVVHNSKKFGEKPAFEYAGKDGKISKSFIQLEKDVFALGSYFYSIGMKDAKIVLYAENSYEWVVTYLAAACGGNTIVPLDKELKPQEAAVLVRACGSQMIVHSKKKASLLDEFEEGEIKASLCLDNFAEACEKGAADTSEFAAHEIDVEKCCAIIYTSGTTGNPKGVMLCQRNLVTNMIRAMETLKFPFGTPEHPKGTLAVLPFNHTFGMMATVLCQIHSGVTVYINAGLKYVLSDINIAKPGHISVVPLFVESFYKGIWKNAKKTGKDKLLKVMIKVSNALRKVGIDLRKQLFKSVINGFGGNLEMLITGGAPMPDELIKGFDDIGVQIINGYGISECSPIVSINRHNWSKLGSVGQVINQMQAKTINNNEDGEGEICVKGDIVMMGYYENPEANAAAFTEDGWFNTGDIGKVDEDNFIYITGRKKNLIILENGKNVYPEELEYLIGRIEGVAEVLVYAADGMIVAEIFPEDGADKAKIENEIKDVLNPTIASYKRINSVKFRDTEFVKTTTKKIKR